MKYRGFDQLPQHASNNAQHGAIGYENCFESFN